MNLKIRVEIDFRRKNKLSKKLLSTTYYACNNFYGVDVTIPINQEQINYKSSFVLKKSCGALCADIKSNDLYGVDVTFPEFLFTILLLSIL